MVRNLLLACIFSSLAFSSQAQRVDSLVHLFSLTKPQLDSFLTSKGIPAAFVGTVYDVAVYKVIYNTVSYDSSSIYASGLLAFPSNAKCKLPLSSYGHGTASHREGVPSRPENIEAIIAILTASFGYVSTAPDYIGLGDAPPGLLHPYQDATTEASASIDLLRAARELAPQLNYKLNDQLFITGYSQGGHTTMATHRKIQTDLSNEFTVTASCPMSGPYDLSGVMVDVMLSDSAYAVPGYLPYLALSWNQKYKMYANYSDFLVSPYDTLLPPLFDGQHSMGQINAVMPSVPKLIFKPTLIDTFTNDTNHAFRKALKDNDVYDWKPNVPVRILFCRADKEVTPKNAVVLYNSFKAKGATVDTFCVSETLPHFDCAQVAILNMKGFFTPFQRLDSCVTGINDIQPNNFSIYPNPATNTLYVGFLQETYFKNIVAVNELGQTVALSFTAMQSVVTADVKQLQPGIYFLSGKTTEGKELTIGRFIKM